MAQRKSEAGRRDRVSVSLDPEDIKWIRSFNGASDSYTVSRIIKAARKAGLTLDEAVSGGVLEKFAQFLAKKRRNRHASELRFLIEEFLEDE